MHTEIISIDGPSGSGKTSIGKILARDLNCKFISSGSIYRLITKGVIELQKSNIFFQDLNSFDEIYDAFFSNQFKVKVLYLNNTECLIEYKDLNHKRIHEHLSFSTDLYTVKNSELTSKLSKISVVREAVSLFLKEFVTKNGLTVIEGRDIGSVVFKNAKLKIYIDSPLELRAKRRLSQSSNKEGLRELVKRDTEDINRENSPLIVPDGSVILVNEQQPIEDLVEMIKSEYESIKLS